MIRTKQLLIACALAGICVTHPVAAWEQEIGIGYGQGKEIGQDYQNQAWTIRGKLYKFPKLDNTLIATIDGSAYKLHADATDHKNLITASIGLALRAYFANPELHSVRPYLGASSGPAYLSNQQFGERQQGSNFDLQTTLEGGIELQLDHQHSLDINLHLVHYCNAGLFNPNQGFNVPYVLSVGYQF